MDGEPFSDCQKSLAEFAPAGANKVQSIFAGGVYVGKNTLPARKRASESESAAASRSLFQREPSEAGLVGKRVKKYF